MQLKHFNILIIAARYPGYGGIERVTTQLANHWTKSHKVVIASLRQQEESLLENLSSSVKLKKFPYSVLGYNKENVKFLNELIESENIDLLIYQDSYFPCQYLLKDIHNKKVKIILVEHSCPNGYEKEYKLSKNLNLINRVKEWINFHKSKKNELKNRKFLYHRCDKYILLSDPYISICQRLGRIKDKKKFTVIGNPLSLNLEDINLDSKIKECVFVGRLDRVKGIDRLLRIWSKIEMKVPDWQLTIVGDGEEKEKTRIMINSLKLKRVNIEGFQKNVEKYYRRAKIYCMCSTYEGFPMVLPEAMAFGVVPIAFNSFEAYDNIVSDGINGISVKSFDEDIYASKLLSLMHDEKLLKKMQLECISRSEDFTPDSIFSKWNSLFSDLSKL